MLTLQKNSEKCLLVTPHFFPMYGGALTVYDALAREAGGQIEILTAFINYMDSTSVNGWQRFDAAAPYTIHRIEALRPPLSAQRKFNLCRSLKRNLEGRRLNRLVLNTVLQKLKETRATILCIGALESLGWLAKAVQKRSVVKSVMYVHGEEVSQKAYSRFAEHRRQVALHTVDKVVVVSKFTAGLVSSKYGVPNDRIQILNNGVDLRKFSQQSTKETMGFKNLQPDGYVLSVGRLVARKGFDKLVKAWPQVLEQVPDAKLVIGGKGPLAPLLKQLIAELGLGNSITMLGWIEEETLPSVYKRAKFFIMPNRTLANGDTEGFGLVLLEAAAMGITSIAGLAGGVPDAVIDNQTGLLVNGESEQAIASAIVKLHQDHSTRKRLSTGAWRHAQEQDWSIKTKELFSVFKEL
jgi:phosphatidylinositol alpha-1,6-mannosyltransferase